MYVISMTSGRRMPAWIVRRSILRKWVGLPWVEVEYLSRGLKGYCLLGRAWMRPDDIAAGRALAPPGKMPGRLLCN